MERAAGRTVLLMPAGRMRVTRTSSAASPIGTWPPTPLAALPPPAALLGTGAGGDGGSADGLSFAPELVPRAVVLRA